MLRIGLRAAAIGLLSLFICSCEQGELLNSEADIINVILPQDVKGGAAIISNDKVRIPKMATTQEENIQLEEQLKDLSLDFVLSSGSRIRRNGVELTRIVTDSIVLWRDEEGADFTFPQRYEVISEDGAWSKPYEVSFFDLFDKTDFHFENYRTFSEAKPYYVFYEVDDEHGEQPVWASGNPGFAITAGSASGDAYPTSVTEQGHRGSGAKLVTRSTGDFGALVGMPIAAGNLFLGNFNLSNATSKPLEATQFGVATVINEPVELTLWAKYKAGAEYKDADGNVLDVVDRPEIYAVLYEPELGADGAPVLLNGTNVKTADNIISIADMTEEQAKSIRVDDVEAAEYVQVRIPFVTREELDFDEEKQKQGIYHIALVFSSSAKGAAFEGAVGSTLYVDEVEIVTK